MRRLGALLLALGLTACEPTEAPVQAVDRSLRFGVFRDLVLFQRPPADGGPFFLDRFESTVADLESYRRAQGESVEPRRPDLLPEVGIDLREAANYAAWRFCRVPRADEWSYACHLGDAYKFPWGDGWFETRANTGGLGLGRPAPVGAFESGRSPDGPFDLIGNVAEWTETVEVPFRKEYERVVTVDEVLGLPEFPALERPQRGRWPAPQDTMPFGLRLWLPDWDPAPGAWLESGGWGAFTFGHQERRRVVVLDMPGVDTYRGSPGLHVWFPDWLPAPTDWLVLAEDQEMRRIVVGGHFLSRVIRQGFPQLPESLAFEPGRWDATTGVRLAADPAGLLEALSQFEGSVAEEELAVLVRFLRAHRAVLAPAWRELSDRRGGGSLLSLLQTELGGG